MAVSGEKSVNGDVLATPCASPVVVAIPMGGWCIRRGGPVHCGVSNPLGATHLRVDWHLATGDLVHAAWGDNVQFVSSAP